MGNQVDNSSPRQELPVITGNIRRVNLTPVMIPLLQTFQRLPEPLGWSPDSPGPCPLPVSPPTSVCSWSWQDIPVSQHSGPLHMLFTPNSWNVPLPNPSSSPSHLQLPCPVSDETLPPWGILLCLTSSSHPGPGSRSGPQAPLMTPWCLSFPARTTCNGLRSLLSAAATAASRFSRVRLCATP